MSTPRQKPMADEKHKPTTTSGSGAQPVKKRATPRSKHAIKRMLEEDEASAKGVAILLEEDRLKAAELDKKAIVKVKITQAPSFDPELLKIAQAVESDAKAPKEDEKKSEPNATGPVADDKPEFFDELFGPYAKVEAAMEKRNELLAKQGFPMLSQSSITQKKDGFYIEAKFRARFPIHVPQPEVWFDKVPGMDTDSKDN